MKTVNLNPSCDLQKELNNLSPFSTVVLSPGIYKQKLVLSVPNLTIKGCGLNTVITFDDYANKLDLNGVGLGTFKSFTVAVTADNVCFENLTIENSAGNPKDLGQQVALSVYGNNFKAIDCYFKSTQDTLFLAPLPDDLVVRYDNFLPNNIRFKEGQTYQKFINCKIEGTVDYIFGCANAYFENCQIVTVNDGRDICYVTAPAHPLANQIGFVFYKCNLTSLNAPTTYLARPWRDFGKSTFICCDYDKHIPEVGFINWQDTYRTKTARFYEYSKIPYKRAYWTTSLTNQEAQNLIKDIKPYFDF